MENRLTHDLRDELRNEMMTILRTTLVEFTSKMITRGGDTVGISFPIEITAHLTRDCDEFWSEEDLKKIQTDIDNSNSWWGRQYLP